MKQKIIKALIKIRNPLFIIALASPILTLWGIIDSQRDIQGIEIKYIFLFYYVLMIIIYRMIYMRPVKKQAPEPKEIKPGQSEKDFTEKEDKKQELTQDQKAQAKKMLDQYKPPATTTPVEIPGERTQVKEETTDPDFEEALSKFDINKKPEPKQTPPQEEKIIQEVKDEKIIEKKKPPKDIFKKFKEMEPQTQPKKEEQEKPPEPQKPSLREELIEIEKQTKERVKAEDKEDLKKQILEELKQDYDIKPKN